MKPKEALVKDGFLPAGSENARGRLSGAAKERLTELAKQGWDIEGYSVSSSPTAAVPRKAVSPAPRSENVGISAAADEPVHSELEYHARVTPVGKEAKPANIGMRQVCNNCRRSLTHCICRYPVVFLDFDTLGVVEFKMNKAKG